MKIRVVVDENGKLVGAARVESRVVRGNTISSRIRPVDPKHSVQELEVADDFFKYDEASMRKEIQSKVSSKR